MLVQRGRLGQGVDLVNRYTVGCFKRTRPNAAQPFDMTITAQSRPQITGYGPHIAAFATDHFQHNMIGVGTIQHDQAVHVKCTRL